MEKEKIEELLGIVSSALMLLEKGAIPVYQLQATKSWFLKNAPEYLQR